MGQSSDRVRSFFYFICSGIQKTLLFLTTPCSSSSIPHSYTSSNVELYHPVNPLHSHSFGEITADYYITQAAPVSLPVVVAIPSHLSILQLKTLHFAGFSFPHLLVKEFHPISPQTANSLSHSGSKSNHTETPCVLRSEAKEFHGLPRLRPGRNIVAQRLVLWLVGLEFGSSAMALPSLGTL
jgi:hypothetical protein